jgi:signal transduction histidine kinase
LLLPLPGIATDPSTSSPGDVRVVDVLSVWGFFLVIPFAAGRVVSNRAALIAALRLSMREREQHQDLRDRQAAAAERGRIARELHDVIAHNVSVMVIQTAAARAVAASDRQAAGDALRSVSTCGGDALADLRRMVGVLQDGDRELAGDRPLGLSQLDRLADHARASGVSVEITVAGEVRALPAGLDLALFRIVQEALTNAIKHAGRSHVLVCLSFGGGWLDLEIVDSGLGSTPAWSAPESGGYGLKGMRERLAPYGGQLRAEPRPNGGFEVSTRVPLVARSERKRLRVPTRESWSRWFDPLLAAVAVVLCEMVAISELSSDHGNRHWLLAVNVALVAGMTVPFAWRRRAPLLTTCVVMSCLALFLIGGAADIKDPTFPQVVLFLAPYSVAAYALRSSALVGLAACLAAVSGVLIAISAPVSAGVFVIGATCGSWVVGRIIRARRRTAAVLEVASERIDVEGESRELLAIASQRTHIAADLDALVTNDVDDMIQQARRALSLLDDDAEVADTAMAAVQQTGRHVLSQMRLMLGVLRECDGAVDFDPQPGIGQIPILVEEARRIGHSVTLTVEGEPGLVPTSVDRGLYRIVEDILADLDRGSPHAIHFAVNFGSTDVELSITHEGDPERWPLPAIRERVSLCYGQLRLSTVASDRDCLVVRRPRLSTGALA